MLLKPYSIDGQTRLIFLLKHIRYVVTFSVNFGGYFADVLRFPIPELSQAQKADSNPAYHMTNYM